MKIVHIELAGFYNEGMSYQTNMLVSQNCRDGHEVLVISSNYQFVDGEVCRVTSGQHVMAEGAVLIRLPYFPSLKRYSFQKLRYARGIYKLLEQFKPDVVFIHCTQTLAIFDIIHYKKDHPEVKLYADTHTAYYNSGMNWLSLHVLHRILYRYLTQKVLPYLEKYFYIGQGEKKFSMKEYKVPESVMEYYPLGGTLFPEEVYEEKRARRRAELGLAHGELLLLHSGKMGALKKTADLLRAFAAVPKLKAKLAVIGSIPKDMESTLLPLLERDSRVVYLGWKASEDLLEYLCAADLYCQPGSVSAIMQNAICCGCPVLSFPHESYVDTLDCSEFFWARSQTDMESVFSKLASTPEILKPMTEGAWRCAREILDYRQLAARLYQ
ncbi:glycosyltransferase [Lawsonibacter sp. LCP25S3_G6]|uniref:glycosyltransferase n=1 Tax=unclassified Lawsonibacter TaxID=2617946 RepID=UPI003F971DA0